MTLGNELIRDAYLKLFPNKDYNYRGRVIYSGRFKDFGANVRLGGSILEFKLSRKWHSVSDEIKIGLMQELMLKLFKPKSRQNTMYIDLYNNFVKNLHISIPKSKSHPVLEESFNRINERYFLGLVEKPNLVWGRESKRTLGSYDYKTDTITISKIFVDAELRLLDYVMFHESLHKQRKFERTGSTTRYHDSQFRKLEKVYENSEQLEKDLNKFAASYRIRSNVRAMKTAMKFWKN